MGPAHPVEIGAALAYAAPAGSAEQGARVSDTAWGLVAIDADVSYRFTPALAAVLWGRLGAGIPTLCATAADCESSLGRDVALGARARFFFPSLGVVEPRVDAGVGYEWSMSKLSDNGVVSRRTYDGPIVLALEGAAPFRLGERWTLGPVAALALGVFSSAGLETSAFTLDRPVAGHALHAWLSLGIRTGVRF